MAAYSIIKIESMKIGRSYAFLVARMTLDALNNAVTSLPTDSAISSRLSLVAEPSTMAWTVPDNWFHAEVDIVFPHGHVKLTSCQTRFQPDPPSDQIHLQEYRRDAHVSQKKWICVSDEINQNEIKRDVYLLSNKIRDNSTDAANTDNSSVNLNVTSDKLYALAMK